MREIICPNGKAISGDTVYELTTEELGYEQQRGRNKSFVPTTAFCPQCSELYEWDSRWNEPKPKWSHSRKDFIFDLSYEEDEDGLFVKCQKCGYDFRQEPKEMEGSQTKPKVKKKETDFVQEWLKNVRYWQGYYIMTVEEFKRMATVGYTCGVKMNPCAKVAGMGQYILWNDFLTHYEKLNIDGIKMIGLPRHRWKNL